MCTRKEGKSTRFQALRQKLLVQVRNMVIIISLYVVGETYLCRSDGLA